MTCFGPSFLSEGTPVKLPNGRFQVGLVSHSFSEGWMSVIQDLWVRDSFGGVARHATGWSMRSVLRVVEVPVEGWPFL